MPIFSWLGSPAPPRQAARCNDRALFAHSQEGKPFGCLSRLTAPAARLKASQEEIKLAEMEGEYIPRDLIHARMGEIAGLIRGCGEQLQRIFGPEALQILDDALDDVGKIIAEWKSTSTMTGP